MAADPERTDDGRYLIVDGRRWRASDPEIPEPLRKELVSELMAARRAVRDAEGDGEEQAARARVRDAKVALGERGAPWWEELAEEDLRERLAAAIRALLRKRGEEKTICPSDAARVSASPDWREWMPLARDVASELADDGVVELTQAGKRVEPGDEVRGAIRIRAAKGLGL